MPANIQRKILTLDELVEAVDLARSDGRTIVQCHGCFDIVHPGHMRYLEFARAQGDVLVVTISGDDRLTHAGQTPYVAEQRRAENVAALMFVDFVHIDPGPTAESVLARIRPDVCVRGQEHEHSCEPAFLAEVGVVEGYGGRVIFSSGEVDFSSVELLEPRLSRDTGPWHRVRQVVKRNEVTGDKLTQTLDRFRDLNVLVVGDVVVDRYVLCDALSVASESPMINLTQRDERCYVGGAAIVARHVAALGAHAFLLSSVGDDDATPTIRNVLAGEGVESHLMESRPDNVCKTRFMVDDAKLLKVNRGRRYPLDSVAERQAALLIEQQAKLADAVILCDFGYGMITSNLLGRVLPMLRHNVHILAADISGGRANMLHFQHVDLLCPTEREVRTTLNNYDSGLSAVAWDVLARTQARHLMVTLEKRGMVVFERSSQDRNSPEWSGRLRSEQLPSLADTPVDRLGCGDALLASATMALASGADVVQAAYVGSAAAALEIAMLGNHPVRQAQLRDWMSTRRELAPPTAPPSAAPSSATPTIPMHA